jgi:hypothetical protein
VPLIKGIPVLVVDSELHEYSTYDNLGTTVSGISVVRTKASDVRIVRR